MHHATTALLNSVIRKRRGLITMYLIKFQDLSWFDISEYLSASPYSLNFLALETAISTKITECKTSRICISQKSRNKDDSNSYNSLELKKFLRDVV